MSISQPYISLLGASPTTTNLGVTALSHSFLSQFSSISPEYHLLVYDYFNGVREGQLKLPDKTITYSLFGSRISRNFLRQEHLPFAKLLLNLNIPSKSTEFLKNTSCFFDLSGGDSFTEMYGKKRFDLILGQKEVALSTGRPLVLLPQTYGPFYTKSASDRATKVILKAAQAWARDIDSFNRLKTLLGNQFDSNKHHLGVDLAFGLPLDETGLLEDKNLLPWLKDRSKPILGINISGLIYQNPDMAKATFKHISHYKDIITQIIKEIVKKNTYKVLLIPHVMAPKGSIESDQDAISTLIQDLSLEKNDHVYTVKNMECPSKIKSIISQCDWFCGTRMHSTIAALSTGVPTCTIAYSLKAKGVFDRCGLSKNVFDLRSDTEQTIISGVLSTLESRESDKQILQKRLVDIKSLLDIQMAQFASVISKA